MKCKACGQPVVIFNDGWVIHVIEKPRYGQTEYHICAEAQGETSKMLSRSMMKAYGLPIKE